MMVGSLAWFMLVIAVFIPHFRGGVQYMYLDRYPSLGNTLPGILESILSNPGQVIRNMLIPKKIEYMVFFFLPTGFLFLLEPWLSLCMAPSLFGNLFSDYEPQYSITFHYHAQIIAILFGASVLGAARLKAFLIRTFHSDRIQVTGILFAGSSIFFTTLCLNY